MSIQLHKWHTNCWQLLECRVKNGTVPKSSKPLKKIIKKKVLDSGWNNFADTLHFDIQELTNLIAKNVIAKRFVLQTLGQTFSPIRLLDPFTVRMQKMWLSALDWDSMFSEDLKSLWNNCAQISQLVICLWADNVYFYWDYVINACHQHFVTLKLFTIFLKNKLS